MGGLFLFSLSATRTWNESCQKCKSVAVVVVSHFPSAPAESIKAVTFYMYFFSFRTRTWLTSCFMLYSSAHKSDKLLIFWKWKVKYFIYLLVKFHYLDFCIWFHFNCGGKENFILNMKLNSFVYFSHFR